ncbi:MAG: hypothetical protein OEV42_02575 [Deltaproteobacteria bacterium]|nr:hypothetical protein [Deltaproteobacteria bacterium]
MDHLADKINPVKQTNIRAIGLIVLIAILIIAYVLRPCVLGFKAADQINLPTMFGSLILIALFVERSIEMFLSVWRSQGADNLDRMIEKSRRDVELKQKELEKLPDNVSNSKGEEANNNLSAARESLDNVEDKRVAYRVDSRFIALWAGLLIGIFVSLVGVRVLGNIVEFKCEKDFQEGLFTVVDILLTGSMLAGGSESINRLMKVYNNVMSATSERAKGKGQKDQDESQ